MDAVDAVANATGKTSLGRPEFRLLGWVVAEARGVRSPFDSETAELVGRRFNTHVRLVRKAIEAASSNAEAARLAAKAAAGTDEALAATLESVLAGIDEVEQRAVEHPDVEIYILRQRLRD